MTVEKFNFYDEILGPIYVVYSSHDEEGNPQLEQVEIAKRYWLRNEDDWVCKVSEIARSLGIPSHQVPKFVASKLDAYIHDDILVCKVCKSNLILSSRSQFTQILNEFKKRGEYYCGDCVEQKNACLRLQAEQAKLTLDQKIDAEKERIESRAKPYDYNQLNLRGAAYLQAWLIASGDSWNGRLFATSSSAAELIHPDVSAAWDTLRVLRHDVIYPSRLSSNKAFVFKDSGFSFDMSKVIWSLSPSDQGLSEQSLMMLLDGIIESATDKDKKNVYQFWKDIALAETLQYLHTQANVFRFNADKLQGASVQTALFYALKYYSIGQVRNFIWTAVKNAAALTRRGDFHISHAVNTISGNIRKNVDRARAENWIVQPYGRRSMDTEPLLTSILFDKVFGCGGEGFLCWTERNVIEHLPGFEPEPDEGGI